MEFRINMNDEVLMKISFFIVIATIAFYYFLYKLQKRQNSIYNEVIKMICNNKNNSIKKLSDIILLIIGIILIILELSILLPDFKWGWIDRSDLIAILGILLSGLTGIIGSVIGIMGAFILFRYQVDCKKKEESIHSSEIIKELLLYTVKETEKIVLSMINGYFLAYVKGLIVKDDIKYNILKKKIKNYKSCSLCMNAEKIIRENDYYKEGTFPHLIECLIYKKSTFRLNEMQFIDDKVVGPTYNGYDDIREKSINNVIKSFKGVEYLDGIVYYDNWRECIYNIENINPEDIRDILIWLNILNKKLKIINKKLETTLKEEEQSDIISNICKFIYYRDCIIKILMKYFNVDGLYTSTELMIIKFDKIKVIKK